jgi:hypothetical protein
VALRESPSLIFTASTVLLLSFDGELASHRALQIQQATAGGQVKENRPAEGDTGLTRRAGDSEE